ncbi:MAG: 50S ribosomal protein L25 [Limnochordaceae bacterium]|nr:50S ribosomal protein L25 [Limnochordaceae bacterium]
MAELSLQVKRRIPGKKGDVRQLRRQGLVPGVLYGPGRSPVAVAADQKAFGTLLQKGGRTHLFPVSICDEQGATAEEASHVVVKDVQHEPVGGQVLHFDLYQVPLDRESEFTLPIVLVGAEQRPQDGGIIEHDLREIRVACRPDALPDHIEVNVAGMAAGDSLTVGQLTPPAGVRFLNPPGETVVSIVLPRQMAAEEEAAPAEGEAEEAKEPELVGRKKEEGETEEA